MGDFDERRLNEKSEMSYFDGEPAWKSDPDYREKYFNYISYRRKCNKILEMYTNFNDTVNIEKFGRKVTETVEKAETDMIKNNAKDKHVGDHYFRDIFFDELVVLHASDDPQFGKIYKNYSVVVSRNGYVVPNGVSITGECEYHDERLMSEERLFIYEKEKKIIEEQKKSDEEKYEKEITGLLMTTYDIRSNLADLFVFHKLSKSVKFSRFFDDCSKEDYYLPSYLRQLKCLVEMNETQDIIYKYCLIHGDRVNKKLLYKIMKMDSGESKNQALSKLYNDVTLLNTEPMTAEQHQNEFDFYIYNDFIRYCRNEQEKFKQLLEPGRHIPIGILASAFEKDMED